MKSRNIRTRHECKICGKEDRTHWHKFEINIMEERSSLLCCDNCYKKYNVEEAIKLVELGVLFDIKDIKYSDLFLRKLEKN